MGFKKKRGIELNYYQQGYIYFVCANYKRLPKSMRAKLDRVVNDVGGFDGDALSKLLFDVNSSVLSVGMEYNLQEGKLCRLRAEFYKRAYRELTK